MEIGFLIIFIFVIILIVGLSKNKNMKGIESDSKNKKIDLDDTSSSDIRYSDEFKDDNPKIKIIKEHAILKIYMDKNDLYTWVCPNCEVENLPSKRKCIVCNYMK